MTKNNIYQKMTTEYKISDYKYYEPQLLYLICELFAKEKNDH